jgi:vacuolar-type H+-ATPase subunit D/Vma8
MSDLTTSPTTSSSSSVDQAIAAMQKAFDEAIKTNAKITTLKTHLGSIETVAQQRPNVG